MTINHRSQIYWQLRTRSLSLGARTLIMAVVNITPDSFSDGGSFLDPQVAIAYALQCLDDGADILDLGAESTRPGSRAGAQTPAVSTDEEQSRLLPVLEGILKARPNAIISVDTYKAATARAALTAGAEIINDVSGFTWDPNSNPAMPRICAQAHAGVVLMHTRGRPEEWRTQPQLAPEALISLVHKELSASLITAQQAGIPPQSIVLDPGYGFGKRFAENYALLDRQHDLLVLGRPLLTGVSRKSFLAHTLAPLHGGQSAPVNQRESASIAAMVASILHGASIVRVHTVRPAVEAALIADALLQGRPDLCLLESDTNSQ
jgi:dihydropteroate synthase